GGRNAKSPVRRPGFLHDIYRTRDASRADVFDYIERFYNPHRRHSTLNFLSPVQFEQRMTG
ncbi:IS3 family transposase, partial [Burkholderia sp. SIMBA_019]|uniref:IS3 family transposase n=1 Tax=Burkholderia sp. SIMBA_019 TaxID=3085765 RepID=UPI00397E6653